MDNKKDLITKIENTNKEKRSDLEYAIAYSHRVYESLAERFDIFDNFSIGCNDVSDIVCNAIIDALNNKSYNQCNELDSVNTEWKLHTNETKVFDNEPSDIHLKKIKYI